MNISPISNSISAIARDGSLPIWPELKINLNGHVPAPKTAIAFVGQLVEWKNQSSKQQRVTEGNPVFRSYLPITNKYSSTYFGVSDQVTVSTKNDIPLFDSGLLAPNETFSYTFENTGTYPYYDLNNPGETVGQIVVIESNQTVTEIINAENGGVITTGDGVRLEIPPGSLDTVSILSVTTIPKSPLQNGAGMAVSSVHYLEIPDLDNSLSDTGVITMSIPYNPANLPVGTDESGLRLSYYNGRSWVGVRGDVDMEQNQITISTTHLSWWEVIIPCIEPFGFTDSQEISYDTARDYFNALADHQDLFDVLTTASGQRLFSINAKGADWLSKQSICDLDREGSSGIQNNLGISNSPREVAEAMIVLGESLESQTHTETRLRNMWDVIVKDKVQGNVGLLVNYIFDVPINPTDEIIGKLAELYFDFYIKPIWNIAWDLSYINTVEREFDFMKSWLQSSTTQEVGFSSMDHVLASQIESNDGIIQVHYYAPYKGFYQIFTVGNWNSTINDDPVASGYVNLFQKSGLVYFAVGMQDLSSVF